MTAAKKRSWLAPLMVVGVLVGAGFGIAAMVHRGHAPAEKGSVEAPPREVPVTTAPMTIRPVQRSIEVVGTLEGHEEVNLGSKVEGRILRLYHDVGDEVKPGDPLVDFEEVDYRLAELEAKRGLEMELSKLGLAELPTNGKIDFSKVPLVMRARNVEDNARQVMDRARRLGVGRVIGAEEMERAQTEARVALANREQAELEARAILASARLKSAQLDTAQQRLRDCKVMVPCPSPTRMPPGLTDPGQVRYVVASRKVAEGEMIRTMPAVTLFRLVIDNPLKLVATVPERFSGEIKLGQSVTLGVEAFPGETFQGTVSRINPTVERANRTFTFEVTVPNASRKLRPGSFVKARVQTRKADDAMTVPEEAIVRFAGVVKVFVVENGKSRSVPVRTGEVMTVRDKARVHRWVEVVGDLPTGTQVVTSGQSQLADQTLVRVR
ncbi:MAG: efflux RND transporter periplasmic adaptor subunit [Gemmataceae bacterium]